MCGATKYDMGIQAEGIEAEQWLLNHFRNRNIEVFQPDAISFEKGKYILNEIKHQEHYKKPPFNGHGLPIWQVNARLSFSISTGIRTRLIIKEKDKDIIYFQWLDVLECGESFDTKGIKTRRIYPLTSFKKLTNSL